jgi:hypothetical protein
MNNFTKVTLFGVARVLKINPNSVLVTQKLPGLFYS